MICPICNGFYVNIFEHLLRDHAGDDLNKSQTVSNSELIMAVLAILAIREEV